MSVTRNYFGDKGRDRPPFNYRGNDRNFSRNVPTSRHSIFIRGLPASVNASTVKNFFADETRSSVSIDFVSYTDEHKKLCIAIRFESTQLARDMFTKYNNRELLGYNVEFSWYKDLKGNKGKFTERRFQGSYGNRPPPRRFPERRSRSKQRYRDSFEKRREYKSRSRSRDSVSSSSYSKSHSGSDSLSDRSSASPTRLIRTINKQKYKEKRRDDSGESYSSKDRKETKSDPEDDHKHRKKSESCKLIEEANKFDKLLSSFERVSPEAEASLATGMTIPASSAVATANDDQGGRPVVSKVRRMSTELLEDYSRDVERFLSVINVLIGKNPDYEEALVGSLKEILTEVGDKYVDKFATFIEDAGGSHAVLAGK